MKFSIIIPTYNNFNYLKLAIESLKKNSSFDNEIIVHVNGNDDETLEYLTQINIKFTKSITNIGLCSGVNLASKESSTNFIVYAHDDMYFLPKWDYYLAEEINKLNTNLFYLSSTQISHINPNTNKEIANHIYFNAGNDITNFNEIKLLKNYEILTFYDLQGSHWAPHVIHKSIWDRVGGFSEEFDPGFGSDPDLNMKLWKLGVRIFKCINSSRVYHFGSLTTRKNINIIKNNAKKTFILKWGISIDFFIKHYLKRGSIYKEPLHNFKLRLTNIISLMICKIQFFFYKIT